MAGSPIDPVCGMEVSEAEAVAELKHKAQTFYFCSLECNRKFLELVKETAQVFQAGKAPAEKIDDGINES